MKPLKALGEGKALVRAPVLCGGYQYVRVAAPWVSNGRRWLRRSWEIAVISLFLP